MTMNKYKFANVVVRWFLSCFLLGVALPSLAADPGANSITAIDVSAQTGDKMMLKFTLSDKASVPASFTVNNPPRIALDFPNTSNATGKNSIPVGGSSTLRSVNVVEASGRTRVVLNMDKVSTYETRVDGNTLFLSLSTPSGNAVTSSNVSTQFAAAPIAPAAGSAIKNIDFRRGKNGEGKIVVDLPSNATGIDIRQQGRSLVVDFAKIGLSKELERRMDVSDFGTPVQKIDASVQSGNARMVIEPKGIWEYSAYQTDNQFVVEVKQIVEDPTKLTQGSKFGYRGDKLSLNFQNVEVRTVLQVIAEFTGMNIITSDTVNGSLTLRLKDVPWDQALDTLGQRIATSPLLEERLERRPELAAHLQSTKLTDGRVLWILRPGPFMGGRMRMNGPGPGFNGDMRGTPGDPRNGPNGLRGPEDNVGARGRGGPDGGPGNSGPFAQQNKGPQGGPPPFLPNEPWLSPLGVILPAGWAGGVPELVIVLLMVFIAVAVGAWPVANRLTRRLKQLRHGVERFGEGQLQHRVEVEGKDEVADVARSFNQAAQRIEELVTSHRSLLANASHELRSPLARMKMALSMLGDVPPEHASRLKEEIHQDIRELNDLVEEVLLASRLDARPTLDLQPVDVLGLLIEEAGRVGAEVDTETLPAGLTSTPLRADERLLRRAVRNLLENARRYGRTGSAPAAVEARLRLSPGKHLDILIEDRGPGVPPEQCERIFEPFYRMPGHAEHAGGVGLGLSLVAQIAQRHGGEVRCEAREGGGSRFVIRLPLAAGVVKP